MCWSMTPMPSHPTKVGKPAGELRRVITLRDPAHEEHHEALTWGGGSFDPTSFDIKLVNALLRSEFAY